MRKFLALLLMAASTSLVLWWDVWPQGQEFCNTGKPFATVDPLKPDMATRNLHCAYISSNPRPLFQ